MGRCPARGPFVAAESPAAQVVQGRLTRNFLLMYYPNRLEWHSGVEAFSEPRVGAVRSCMAVSESFGTLQSPRCCSRQEPRPQSISSGFFAFADRTPHEVGAASGAARKETATRYAARLGGSSRITRAAGRIIKPRGIRYPTRSMMIPQGGETFPLYSCWGRGVFG